MLTYVDCMNDSTDAGMIGPSTLETIGAPSTSKAPTPPPPSMADTQSAYAQQLADVPEFANYGQVLNSSTKPAPLTESETEYQVSVVKHIFKEHIVFQVISYFDCLFVHSSEFNKLCSSTCPTRSQILCWSRSPSLCSLKPIQV